MNDRKNGFARYLLHLAWILPLVIISLYLANPAGVPTWDPRGRLLGVIPYTMPAESMAPTFRAGAQVVACTWSYVGSMPARGDVIVFRPPHAPENPFLKRVVGLEGESVRFTGGTLHVDGVAQLEPYLAEQDTPGADFEAVVPEGHVFVAGDNRSNSFDSRHFGPVPTTAIIGRICASF